MDFHQSNSYLFLLFVLLVLVVAAGVMYYYRESIKKYAKKLFNSSNIVSKEVVEIKGNDEELKETKSVSEENDKIVEKDKLKIKKKGELVVDNKIVKESKKDNEKKGKSLQKTNIDKRQYSQNQIVNNDDTYCYIGKDDNMRQCIKVFKNDVCTSGDIFNLIDECLVPQRQ